MLLLNLLLSLTLLSFSSKTETVDVIKATNVATKATNVAVIEIVYTEGGYEVEFTYDKANYDECEILDIVERAMCTSRL